MAILRSKGQWISLSNASRVACRNGGIIWDALKAHANIVKHRVSLTRGAGSSFVRTAWPTILACAVLMPVLAADASEQIAAAQDIVVTPDTTLHEQLRAGERRTYRLTLDAGQAAELRLRQLALTSVELHWTDDPSRPPSRVEDGREGLFRATVIAPQPTSLRFQIAARSKDLPANYELAVSPTHATEAVDRRRAAAEAALAKADDLRVASGSSELGQNTGSEAVKGAMVAYQEALLAWQAVPDSCGIRRVLSGQARLQFAHGDYPGAQTSAQAALNSACDRGDDLSGAAEAAEAERTLGAALAYQGDFEAAIAAQEHAAGLYQQTRDSAYQNAVFGNLSTNYREIGELGKAQAMAEASAHAAEATGDNKRILYGRVNLAAMLVARGKLSSALDAYRQVAEATQRTPYPMVENMAWNSLGVLYREFGDTEQALQAYQNAERVATTNEDRSAIAESLHNQAYVALDAGRINLAADLFRRGLELAHAENLEREEEFDLRGLGRCALQLGDFSAARVHLLAATAIAQHEGVQNAKIDVEIAFGDLESRQQRLAAARAHYAEALTLARHAQSLNQQPTPLAGLARVEMAAGNLIAAKRDIEQALTLIESERAQIDAPSLRTSYFTSKRSYYELYIDILMQLDRNQHGHTHAAAALEAVERARARSLQDMLSERGISIDKNVDPALLAQERIAEDQARSAAYQLARLTATAAAGRRERLEKVLDQASADLDQTRGRIRAAYLPYAELSHPRKLAAEEIQNRLLDADTVLLEYWLGDMHSYLWVVTRSGLHSYTLPARSQIEAPARKLHDLLIARAPVNMPIEQLAEHDAANLQSIRATGRQLGELLLDPAVHDLHQHKRVAIVADGALQLDPFGVMAVAANGATLGADHELVYLPSIATLRWLRRTPMSAPVNRRLAVFADPVFRADDPRLHGTAGLTVSASLSDTEATPVLRAASDLGFAELPRLPHSREEADTVAQLFPQGTSWLALDFDASREAALGARWEDYGIVHFATHGLLDLRHPDLSGVVLSLYDAQGRPRDGYLRMNDIYNLRLPADLVVLSACESALGPEIASEGIYSLARAFFYAGAPRVLGTLWAVDDRASAKFMAGFYRALLAPGGRPASALRSAQQAIAADPRWQAPYYWAGYVLQGDWR
jgi:CHAT domain-containing protein